MRTLGGSRFTVEAGHVAEEAGGCLLSVDLSQAFDRVNRAKLDAALQAHQVDADLRSTVAAIHEEAAYRVRDRFQQSSIFTTQGIRQGCRLARPHGPYYRPKSSGTSRHLRKHPRSFHSHSLQMIVSGIGC